MTRISSLALATGLAFALATPAHADDPYPSRPIKIVVGYTAGGASDIVGRMIGQKMTELLGQPTVIENRPGVGGILGMDYVARSAPDGYTIGVCVSGSMVTGPHLTKAMPYDPLTAFEPVGQIALAPLIMVATPDAPFSTVKELIAQSKQGNGLMYGSGAQAFDLAMRYFNAKAGTTLSPVQYPGSAQVQIDVMAGRVPIEVDTVGASQANVKAGKLKAIAVLDSRRSAVFPDVPTVAESGVPGFEAKGWLGMVTPKGTSPAIVAKLNETLVKIMAMPDVKDKLTTLGFEPNTTSPAEFATLVKREYALWGKVVKDSGMAAE
jgi:tripartite-type tricarboxylate transporter receptor subunit TctC